MYSVDAFTKRRIEALLRYLKSEKSGAHTASRLAEAFQLDIVIVRALAADRGIRLRDTGEVAMVDPDADTQKMVMPPEAEPSEEDEP